MDCKKIINKPIKIGKLVIRSIFEYAEIKKDKKKQYTDKQLRVLNWSKLVLEESLLQVHKWGIQTQSLFEWLTYTTEELGSLAKAISEFEYRKGSKDKVVAEAIQVATLALKIAEMVKGEE